MGTRFRWPAGAIALTLAVVLGQGGVAKGSPIIDPTGDFPVTYTGSKTGAFDVIFADGTFDGKVFRLTATLAAPVNSAPPGSTPLYVWGIQTGPLNPPGPFANTGNPNVLFNRVFTLNALGVTNNPNVIGRINGANISIDVPASILTSTGFAPQDFRWNLWPRDSAQPGGNGQISDFAPDNAVTGFTSIPEPTTLAVFGGLLGVLGLGAYRRSAHRT